MDTFDHIYSVYIKAPPDRVWQAITDGDETVRYYNRVRSLHPTAAIKLFEINFGHNPRAGGIAASDLAKLTAAEDGWFAHYVKGTGPAPADAQGGVDVITSVCPGGAVGAQYTAANWASLAPGPGRSSPGRRRANT